MSQQPTAVAGSGHSARGAGAVAGTVAPRDVASCFALVLHAVIDSMVFDAIVAERDGLRAVDRLTRAGRLQLLAAATTMEEIAAVADVEHRRRLEKVRVLVLPPPRPHVAFRDLMRSVGVSESDARIALTAAEHGVPLVTEDGDLRAAAAAHLPGLVLWRWAEDLRPRIAAL